MEQVVAGHLNDRLRLMYSGGQKFGPPPSSKIEFELRFQVWNIFWQYFMGKRASWVVKSSQNLGLEALEFGTCDRIYEFGGRPELLDVYGNCYQKIINWVYLICTYSNFLLDIVWAILKLNPKEDLKIFWFWSTMEV